MLMTLFRCRALLPIVVSLFLAACAAVPAPVPEEALESRVDAYYAALISRDYRKAYEYFSPGYRSRYSFESHYTTYPPFARYEGARIIKKECATEDACRVTVMADLLFTGEVKELKGVRTSTAVPERWVRVDGRWWILPQR